MFKAKLHILSRDILFTMNENRFLNCARENRSNGRTWDPENRFERAYMEHKKQISIPYERHERFECLRENYVPKDSFHRFECLRDDSTPKQSSMEKGTTGGITVYYETKTTKKTTPAKETSPSLQQILQEQTFSKKPPGLSSPISKRKECLNLQNDSQFPTLPGSPTFPKTPKHTPVEPLREEIEFIPLPKSESQFISLSLSGDKLKQEDSEQEQMYKVVRKISGGSWSERLKYAEQRKLRTNSEMSSLDYDEDGFPMIKEIESMVNSFT